MPHSSMTIRPEQAGDFDTLAKLTWDVFGPVMFERAAYALRENMPHEMSLSFVAEAQGDIVGTVRLTRICIGGEIVLMLGPLAVSGKHEGKGAGKLLMAAAVNAAREQARQGGPKVIMLVGNHPYYGPFGFEQVPADTIKLPLPTDPARILLCKFDPDIVVSGKAENLSETADKTT